MTRNQNQDKKNGPFIKLGFPPSDELYPSPWEHGQATWEEMGHRLHKIHSELSRSGQLPHNKRTSKNNQSR